MRLDQWLTINQKFESRHQAQIEIKQGRVLVNQVTILKPSYQVEDKDTITLLESFNPYVSKGGLKLKKALDTFHVDFKDLVICDIGASTGGFTEVALSHKAHHVYAIEKGVAQMHQSLINHP
jgi:23S rRNA (cytidine1920-2'-O)/16S rRNA (cytidine1409-2'-O)-methyltransferase